MKFVALLSGGKDSCFNISHCQKNGHQLIAAASLRPSEGIDELDSYLYQTVGQDVIEFVAQALEVPLYRRIIVGTAVQMENEYGTRRGISESSNQAVEGDETEDMFQLLREVLRHHPEIEAVSVGAILSTYQRIRVEHVCRRLGLTSLSYLWQRDQGELLQEMLDCGVNAILIKVAGIGLKPHHLGQSLAQMQPVLQNLVRRAILWDPRSEYLHPLLQHTRFGSHICGEGGEYETLTLDCPAFKKRVVLTETETVIQEDKGFATVAYWRIKSAELHEKPYPSHNLLTPSTPLLGLISEQIYGAAAAMSLSLVNPTTFDPSKATNSRGIFASSTTRRGRWIAIGNVLSDHIQPITIEKETRACFENLKAILSQHNSDFTTVVHITALLDSMDAFSAFNGVYSRMFGTSPPARACVAVDLPSPHRVVLECLAFADASPRERSALHVQGISYWAPANIGPYSQAIGIDDIYHVSGQIGLIPPTMAMPVPLDVAKEMALSLQHVRRIREVLPLTPSPDEPALYMGLVVWATATETLPAVAAACMTSMNLNGVSKVYDSDQSNDYPPVLFVVPTALPKGATVEVQAIFQSIHEPDDDHPRLSAGITTRIANDLREDTSELSNERSFAIFWFNQNTFGSIVQSVRARLTGKAPLSLRIYHSTGLDTRAVEAVDALRVDAAVTVIPVRGVFSMPDSKDAPPTRWDLAIVSLIL